MPARLTVEEVENASELALGKSPWRKIGREEVAAFQRGTASPTEEAVPPFLLLSLIPGLLRELLRIEGTTELHVVGIAQARFVLEVAVGEEVQLDAVLLKATRTPEGHLLCTVGCGIMKRDEEDFPAVMTEVLVVAA